jgi:acetyl esterase/lipase
MVASIEYRLAPEHKWPAPLEDVVDAVVHLLDHAHHYGADTRRVALAGESAGGHLTILTGTDRPTDGRVHRRTDGKSYGT